MNNWYNHQIAKDILSGGALLWQVSYDYHMCCVKINIKQHDIHIMIYFIRNIIVNEADMI